MLSAGVFEELADPAAPSSCNRRRADFDREARYTSLLITFTVPCVRSAGSASGSCPASAQTMGVGTQERRTD